MRSLLLALGLALTSLLLNAETPITSGPPGFALWDAKLVAATAARLERELGEQHMVYQTIGNYAGHSMYLVLRGKTGAAELHETEADFYISMRGSATFVIGGELVDAESRPRKQQRGSAVSGGARHTIKTGDIVHVPVAVPHHIIIGPDEPYLYLLIKLDEEPLVETPVSAL